MDHKPINTINCSLNNNQETALHLAAKHGLLELATFLIDSHADINRSNWHGDTPLFYAAFYGSLEIAQLLLTHNCIDTIENHDHETALFYAIYGENLAIVRLLLENKAEVNTLNSDDITPLEAALATSNPTLVALLLEHGAITGYTHLDAELEAAKSAGFTPLQQAVTKLKKPLLVTPSILKEQRKTDK